MFRFPISNMAETNNFFFHFYVSIKKDYLLWELLLLQLFEYPESDILVFVVPDSDSMFSCNFNSDLKPNNTVRHNNACKDILIVYSTTATEYSFSNNTIRNIEINLRTKWFEFVLIIKKLRNFMAIGYNHRFCIVSYATTVKTREREGLIFTSTCF